METLSAAMSAASATQPTAALAAASVVTALNPPKALIAAIQITRTNLFSPHAHSHGAPIPDLFKSMIAEAFVRATIPVSSLPASPAIYIPMISNPNGPPPVNRFTDTHPNTIGPGAVCPEDIWDDNIPPRGSELVNLSSFITHNEATGVTFDPRDQPMPVKEHELFMMRVLLPFMGHGTQLMVDERSAFKLDINPGQPG